MKEEQISETMICIECNKEFTRTLPKSRMENAKRQMGAMYDACNDCLKN